MDPPSSRRTLARSQLYARRTGTGPEPDRGTERGRQEPTGPGAAFRPVRERQGPQRAQARPGFVGRRPREAAGGGGFHAARHRLAPRKGLSRHRLQYPAAGRRNDPRRGSGRGTSRRTARCRTGQEHRAQAGGPGPVGAAVGGAGQLRGRTSAQRHLAVASPRPVERGNRRSGGRDRRSGTADARQGTLRALLQPRERQTPENPHRPGTAGRTVARPPHGSGRAPRRARKCGGRARGHPHPGAGARDPSRRSRSPPQGDRSAPTPMPRG